MPASNWCGGYRKGFATNVVKAFDKQIQVDTLEAYTAAGLGNDEDAAQRKAEINEEPFERKRARKWR